MAPRRPLPQTTMSRPQLCSGDVKVLEQLSCAWDLTVEELLAQASVEPERVERRLTQTLISGGGEALAGLSRADMCRVILEILGEGGGVEPEDALQDEREALVFAGAAPSLDDLFTGGAGDRVASGRMGSVRRSRESGPTGRAAVDPHGRLERLAHSDSLGCV